ncbi:hypothetical protein [Ekhidna sp.]|uniref:hypothetical protein n=1 Tax=Ekhidna sp. TaxID=2608089 RepID=UPI003B58EFC4
MKRPLSKEEKKLVKSLIQSGRESFGLIDFVAFNFPKGKFEISTFQQAISLKVSDEELEQVMNHLVGRLNLIKELEHAGYLSVWSKLPIEDNTQTCGNPSVDANTIFLPDISVASELLKYGNYQMCFSDSLIEWSKRNFRMNTISSGFKYAMYALLIVVGVDLLYHVQIIGKNIRSDHQTIVDNNQEVIENQKLNRQIIDSLQSQSKYLILITNRISNNTENMKSVELLINQQRTSIQNLEYQIESLEKELKINKNLIKKTDSLLNLSSTNE